MGNKPHLKKQIQETQGKKITTKTEINYLESYVRFSFEYCDTDKYCIRNFEKDEIETFYATLAKFEKMTWKDVVKMKRDTGLSIEKKDTDNHKMLSELNNQLNTFGHFRVNIKDTPCRIFGGQLKDLFKILLIDRKGEINH